MIYNCPFHSRAIYLKKNQRKLRRVFVIYKLQVYCLNHLANCPMNGRYRIRTDRSNPYFLLLIFFQLFVVSLFQFKYNNNFLENQIFYEIFLNFLLFVPNERFELS